MYPFRISTFLMGLSLFASAYAGPIVSITSTQTTATLRSDSSIMVRWTVKNNASVALTDVNIDPGYQTTGQASEITLANNQCGTSIAAGTSCTFDLVIQGENQPNDFQVTPEVCVFGNHGLCSIPTSAYYLEVSTVAVNHDPYAYIGTYGQESMESIDTTNLSVGNSLTAQIGLKTAGFAVSPDGTKVYLPLADLRPSTLGIVSGGAAPAMISNSFQIPDIRAVALSPNGKTAYATDVGSDIPSDYGAVYVVDVSNSNDPKLITTISGSFATTASPFGIAASPDGTKVYVANFYSNNVSVINASNNEIETTISVGDKPDGVAISPDSSTVYVTNSLDNTVSVINAQTNEVESTINVGVEPIGIAVSPDGSTVYVGNYGGNTVSVIDVSSGGVSSITTGDKSGGVSVTPDGKKVFVTTKVGVYVIQDGTASLISGTADSGALSELGNFVG